MPKTSQSIDWVVEQYIRENGWTAVTKLFVLKEKKNFLCGK